MNRKLHNTLSALTATGALLVVSLIVAAPLMPGQSDARAGTSLKAEFGTAGTLVHALGSAAETLDSGTDDESRPTGASTRNRRQTLVMPFFSFLPRG